jgi:SAM-dependent methyltransferase
MIGKNVQYIDRRRNGNAMENTYFPHSKKLNLACGYDYKQGWINIDIFYDESRGVKPDIILDLQSFPWPIKSDSCEYVLLSHYLEHLPHLIETDIGKQDALVRTMKEVHRILKPRGIVEIRVPDPANIISYFNTPTHYRLITKGVIEAFTRGPGEPQPITFDSSFWFKLIEDQKKIKMIDVMFENAISKRSLSTLILKILYDYNASLVEKLFGMLYHVRSIIARKDVRKELIIKLKKPGDTQ